MMILYIPVALLIMALIGTVVGHWDEVECWINGDDYIETMVAEGSMKRPTHHWSQEREEWSNCDHDPKCWRWLPRV